MEEKMISKDQIYSNERGCRCSDKFEGDEVLNFLHDIKLVILLSGFAPKDVQIMDVSEQIKRTRIEGIPLPSLHVFGYATKSSNAYCTTRMMGV